MKPKIISKVSLVAFLLLSLAASLANAQSEPVYSRGDWVVGLNATRVLTDEDLRSASAGSAPVPNSNLSINNDTTVSFDVSYFLSNQLAFNIFGGIPASADLQGEESLSGLFLGQTDYGPVILSLQYHVLTGSNFSPYFGAGVGRILLSYCQIWCMTIRQRSCQIGLPPLFHPETVRCPRPASVGRTP